MTARSETCLATLSNRRTTSSRHSSVTGTLRPLTVSCMATSLASGAPKPYSLSRQSLNDRALRPTVVDVPPSSPVPAMTFPHGHREVAVVRQPVADARRNVVGYELVFG